MACRQKNRQVCQNCILPFHRKKLRTKVLTVSCLSFFGFSAATFQNCSSFFWGQLCRNCLVSVQRYNLCKSFEEIFFFVFGWWAKKFLVLWKKNQQVCQNCILLLQRTCWGRILTCFNLYWSLNGFSQNSA